MTRHYISQITKISRNRTPLSVMVLLVFLFSVSGSVGTINKSSAGVSTIILDAGHGGKDFGAIVGRAREKEIVLDIALRLGKIIKQEMPDVKVIYTRNGDYFVPLYERSVIANKSNANLFISIHANFCRTSSVKGAETYVLGLHRTQDNLDVAKKENSVILLESDYKTRYEGFDPNSPESYIMFELIQDNYIEQSLMFAGMVQDIFRQHAQRNDRDVRQAGFLVLRETAMPSVLIETGYLSNKSEADYLMTQSGRETIATSIFRSIKDYKTRIESRLNLNSEEAKTTSQVITKNEQSNPDIPKIVPKKSDSGNVKNEIKTEAKNIRPHNNPELAGSLKQSPGENPGTNNISFAIQIAASKVKLPSASKIFKGIDNIRERQISGYFKYFCLESDSLNKIKQSLRLVQQKIPDAFIVGIRNGQIISYKEAINYR
jgi:N-acetylmuramoyl-L-alanine amidase